MKTICGRHWQDVPCGLFFHPTANEYIVLFASSSSKKETKSYEYHMYLLGAKKWRPRVANFHQAPNNTSPEIANRCLYWSIRGTNILVFDMINEKFLNKPVPSERSCCKLRTLESTQDLSVKEGDLCFFSVHIEDTVMDIWVLENNANWVWSKRYSVSLNWGVEKKPVAVGGSVHRGLDFCFCDALHSQR
ncbi:hypothetical protein Salat_1477000 [Sesamum alatum]|uniref:F-box associated beta-propeller type 3 domain-containing protein n=1 Tax=Sesamum alatum TaxID=300844 RepID=A0AAE1YC65_9LAMI|nr:hypothetical protein Salat_1477000 [Sesamum alatum]